MVARRPSFDENLDVRPPFSAVPFLGVIPYMAHRFYSVFAGAQNARKNGGVIRGFAKKLGRQKMVARRPSFGKNLDVRPPFSAVPFLGVIP